MTCAGFQIREERVRVHVRVVQASPMGANLFHDLRVVAGQMAYPVLRVVDGVGEPAAGGRGQGGGRPPASSSPPCSVRVWNHDRSCGIFSLMHSGHCPSFQPAGSIMMFVQVVHSGSRCAGQ